MCTPFLTFSVMSVCEVQIVKLKLYTLTSVKISVPSAVPWNDFSEVCCWLLTPLICVFFFFNFFGTSVKILQSRIIYSQILTYVEAMWSFLQKWKLDSIHLKHTLKEAAVTPKNSTKVPFFFVFHSEPFWEA